MKVEEKTTRIYTINRINKNAINMLRSAFISEQKHGDLAFLERRSLTEISFQVTTFLEAHLVISEKLLGVRHKVQLVES